MDHSENTLEDPPFLLLSSYFGSISARLPSGVSIYPPPTKTSQTRDKKVFKREVRMVVILPSSLRVIERGGLEPNKRRRQKMWPSFIYSLSDRLQTIHYIVDINSFFFVSGKWIRVFPWKSRGLRSKQNAKTVHWHKTISLVKPNSWTYNSHTFSLRFLD